VPASPCTSCPYRRDTPPGVWHPSEYEKLRDYDDGAPSPSFATFLCHHTTETGRDTACRGWLSVHCESVAARLAVLKGEVTDAERYAPVKEPLYASGNEAADAGIKGVKRPGRQARKVIERLERTRK
jgi:hypothetical protein